METSALDYALAAIFYEENEVHLVTFYSYTFTMVKLNYDIYNKELLAIFEAFKVWQHSQRVQPIPLTYYDLKTLE